MSVMSRLLVIGRPTFHWYSLPPVYHLEESSFNVS